MKNKRVTISEIAKEMGVSCSTASRALSGAAGVGPELREKIRSYAQEAGFLPSSITRNSTTGRLNIVAMIVGDIRNPFYADLVFYAQKTLNEHGYLLTVFNTEYDEDKEINYVRLAKRFNFSGIIQVTVTTGNMVAELKNLDIPVVMVNRMLSSFDIDTVLLDNFEAGYAATRYLIELGHSRIGFLQGQRQSSASTQRFMGYEQAMKNYHLEIRDCDILEGDLKMETAYELARKFVHGQAEKPSALIISNDLAALGFVSYCQEARFDVPENLSVVSFDNIPFSSVGSVSLTTIDGHANDMGRKAAEVLLDRINDPDRELQRIILKPELIVRKSTLPYRERKGNQNG